MKHLNLDILFLQETHVNTNYSEVIAGFTFIYSTSITDGQRKQAENLRATPRIDTEHGGVGVILTPLAQAALLDFNQIDGRLFTLTLDAVGPPMHFVNAYAPQSGLDSRIKQEFYHKLEATFSCFPSAHPTFVLGDFNARLHARLPHEIMTGPHIFGRGMQFLLEHMSPITLENRSFFVEFCLAHDLVVGNTLFQKPHHKQITFREAGVSHGPAWTPDRYAQLDFFLVPERWKNSLTDVFSCVETFTESDHYIVKACLSIKRKSVTNQAQSRKTFCKPTSDEYNAYNQTFSSELTGANTKNIDTVLASIRAGTKKLRPTPLGKKQKYLSDKTWQLILERQHEHNVGNTARVTDLTRLVKKEARKDKKMFILDQLKDSLPSNFTKLKDKEGHRVGPSHRAEAIADYLHCVQWKAEALPPLKHGSKILDQDLPFNTGHITLEEFDFVLRTAKNNKAAGPDDIPVELFKYLNSQNRSHVLDVLNDWWTTEAIPTDQLCAQVVSIFKKGDTQNIANYRPISLLNAIYKIYAGIIRKRLADTIDPYISKTQFGFRRHRSTTHALFVARRIQDIGEQSGDNLIIALLDWEKAFDKVSHERMMQALERLNIPAKILKVIRSLYSYPNFRVKHDHFTSENKVQNAGIRQGCPLSPYLFILVMTVMFRDIHLKHHRDLSDSRIERINFNELLYADDTLLISKTTRGMNKFLHAIEEESAYYGLRLNQAKCNILAMNGNNQVRFKDGTLVKHTDEATYLGGILTKTVNISTEISSRIASATATWKSLDMFWTQACCSLKNKILIYNAVIRSKLLYALETVEIPTSQISRLEAFQLKGLRKILGMVTTYIDRSNTNEEVFRRANLQVAPRGQDQTIQSIQSTLRQRRIALVGHILRQDNDHPIRIVSFRSNSAAPFDVLHRRVGRPRKNWLQESLRMVWQEIREDQRDFSNAPEQFESILQAALSGKF